MYSKFTFFPLIGLTGSGKSELLRDLDATGNQVVSLEEEAGVRGVCLAQAFADSLLSQEELDRKIEARFMSFDPQKPVWVEWKGDVVTGLRLPKELTVCLRQFPAWLIDLPVEERIKRLVNYYAEWAEHLDLLTAKLESLPGIAPVLLKRLEWLAKKQDVVGFVRCLVKEHFDPAYELEIATFPYVYRGFIRARPNGPIFYGTYRPIDGITP